MKRHQVFKRAIMFLPCELFGDVSYDTAEILFTFLGGECSLKFLKGLLMWKGTKFLKGLLCFFLVNCLVMCHLIHLKILSNSWQGNALPQVLKRLLIWKGINWHNTSHHLAYNQVYKQTIWQRTHKLLALHTSCLLKGLLLSTTHI